jgi:DNA polymerase-3 subunit delta
MWFRELREGNVRPVYVGFGTEPYLMEDFVHRLAECVTEPEHRDMAIVRFDTAETPLDAIVDEAETVPFLVPRKLIVVRDSTVFGSGRESARTLHKPERLLDYIGQPMDTTVLVFLVPQEKLDERKKLVKAAKAGGFAARFAPLSHPELLQWMSKRARHQGRSMEPDAAEELLRRVGTDMAALAAETDKLALRAGDGGRITAASVAELVPVRTEQSVFRLTEEIAALRTDRAVALYYDLLRQREEPIRLAALLARQFRQMIQVKELGRQGYTPQQMAGQLGMHPYAVKVTADQARHFSAERLASLLERLAELDYGMKTGRVDKTMGLELFLLRTGSEGGS